MQNHKALSIVSFFLIFIGVIAIFFSQYIIEDILLIEREFGEEPLSLTYVRLGIFTATVGSGLLIWKTWKQKRKKD